MMKNIAFTFVLLLFSISFSFAQLTKGEASFVGVWEFLKPQNAETSTPFFTTLKIFATDSTCTQVRVTDKGTFMQQKGKFSVLNGNYFNDIILDDTPTAVKLANKTYKIKYEFMNDPNQNKYLILQGTLESKDGKETYPWKEIWRKVDVLKAK